MPGLRRSLALTAALALALAAGACGNKEAVVHSTDTEGIPVTAGGLTYQVQLSREMDPALDIDRGYFADGIFPSSTTLPAPDEEWFGVWLRVQNNGGRPRRSSGDFRIVDTQDNVYRPVPVRRNNVFAYHPTIVPAGGVLPVADTSAYTSFPRGEVLIFKIKQSVYQNRPAELEIMNPAAPKLVAARVTLDL